MVNRERLQKKKLYILVLLVALFFLLLNKGHHLVVLSWASQTVSSGPCWQNWFLSRVKCISAILHVKNWLLKAATPFINFVPLTTLPSNTH